MALIGQAYRDEEEDEVLSDLDGDEDIGYDDTFVSKLTDKERSQMVPGAQKPELMAEVPADPSVAAAPAPSVLLEIPMSTKATVSRFNADGTLVATGCEDGSVRAFNTTSGQALYYFNPKWHGADDANPGMCTALRFRPSGDFTQNVCLIASSTGTVWHWHATSGKCVGDTIVEENNQTYALDVRGDGASFATTGYDGAVRVYDEATHKLKSTLSSGADSGAQETFGGHSSRAFALKYCDRHADVMVTGGWDNTLQVWDERAGGAVRQIYGPSVCGDALDVDDGEILTGSWRGVETLQVWDLASGALVQDVPFGAPQGDKPCFAYSARFGREAAKGLVVAGGSESNECRVVDRASGRCVQRLAGLASAVTSVELSPNEQLMAVTTGDAVRITAGPRV